MENKLSFRALFKLASHSRIECEMSSRILSLLNNLCMRSTYKESVIVLSIKIHVTQTSSSINSANPNLAMPGRVPHTTSSVELKKQRRINIYRRSIKEEFYQTR